MYALSSWNDCYEILSEVLTLHTAFLSSSLGVLGYRRDINRFFMLSTKIEKWCHLQTLSGLLWRKLQSHNILKFYKGRNCFFTNNVETLNSETIFENRLNFIYIQGNFFHYDRVALKFLTLWRHWCKPYKTNNE